MLKLFDRVAQLNPALLVQRREIATLRKEVERLQRENERIRIAMRRCVPCQYRLAVVRGDT